MDVTFQQVTASLSLTKTQPPRAACEFRMVLSLFYKGADEDEIIELHIDGYLSCRPVLRLFLEYAVEGYEGCGGTCDPRRCEMATRLCCIRPSKLDQIYAAEPTLISLLK